LFSPDQMHIFRSCAVYVQKALQLTPELAWTCSFSLCFTQQDAVGDGRLRPRAATWRTRRHTCGLWCCPIPSIIWNMASSTKPEIHSVSHCGQRRTKPRSQVTSTEKSVNFGRVF